VDRVRDKSSGGCHRSGKDESIGFLFDRQRDG
jgi:hypothetical protein